MKYNPIKHIGNKIDTDFILFLLRINTDFNNLKLSENEEKKIDIEVMKIGGDIEKCRIQRKKDRIIKTEFWLEHRYGFNIYYDFEKAFDYDLLDILEYKILDMSDEAYKSNNNKPGLVEHIKIKKENNSLIMNLAKYNKAPYSIEVTYKPNVKLIHKFLKEYIELWKNNNLKSNNENYLLPKLSLEKYYKFKKDIIDNYGYEGLKINIGEVEKLDFDLISCLVYEHYIGKIEIEFTRFCYDIIHINILDKEYTLYFKGNKLIYGNKDIGVTKQKLIFCKYIFIENKNSDTYNWIDCEETIYGKSYTPPDNGLSNIIKKVNIDLKKIGCNKFFSYSDSQYIKLIDKKI